MPTNPAVLGPLTYQSNGMMTQTDYTGEYGPQTVTVPAPRWAVRGNYRMEELTGNNLQEFKNGQWVPYTLDGGYDPRTENSVQNSNERLRFVQGFMNAPAGFPMNTTGLQKLAIQSGWQEPDRSYNPNLATMLREAAPGFLAVYGFGTGINGMLGVPGSPFPTPTTAAEEALQLGVPAPGVDVPLTTTPTPTPTPTPSTPAEEALHLGVPSDANIVNNTTPAVQVSGGIPASPATAAAQVASGTAANTGMLQQLATSLGLNSSDTAKLIAGGLSALGGLLSGNSAQAAAQTTADAHLAAARVAADAAKFRPVGVTTRFGQSNFTTDANGNLTAAGYTVNPTLKAQQDSLLSSSNGYLNQFTGGIDRTAPMGQAANTMMSLGNSYLSTTPEQQAQKYMRDQQALLATGRERDMYQMLSGEFNRGTYGLATGGTSTGMGAANPRLEAMLNAQRQQDLGLAANATQGGMDYAKFGAGMVGSGGGMLRDMYGTQTAAYDPYKTALGGAQTIEGLGQNAMTLGMDLGRQSSNAAAGGLLANGMNAAAQTMQPANSYSPWGALLTGAGNTIGQMGQPNQNQQYKFDPFTGRPL